MFVPPIKPRASAKWSWARGLINVEAWAMLILGFVTPFNARLSFTDLPVLFRVERIWPTEAEGFCCLSSAHAPATCGAAWDVPSLRANPPPGTEDSMSSPGARRSTVDDMLENEVT